jgi:hypothetical protein
MDFQLRDATDYAPRGELPRELVELLNTPGRFSKNVQRMMAKVAGYPLLWRPNRPWAWQLPLAALWIIGGAVFLVSAGLRGYAWGKPLGIVPEILACIVLFWPFPVAVAAPFLFRRLERRARVALDATAFVANLRDGAAREDAKLAAVVRYAVSRAGGFSEDIVRPDERGATFMRLTLIRYPLLHEFSYYVSERLGQVDPMRLGDFLAVYPRRTVSDLIVGVQEFLRVQGGRRGE